MKTILTFMITVLLVGSVKGQSFYPVQNFETNIQSFSGVNGQWLATNPVNNNLGAIHYQGLNFGFDVNNYASLVNGVGTNELYFGRWSGGWQGWNRIWHSGNLNSVTIDFKAKNLGLGVLNPQAAIDIFRLYDTNITRVIKIMYDGSWGTAQYASDYRFIDIRSTEEGNVLGVNAYGMGIGFNPPSYSSPDKLYVNGNVGIGKTNPTSLLEIFEKNESKPLGVLSPTKSILKLSRSGSTNYTYHDNAEFRIGHGGPGVSGSKIDLYVNGASNTNSIPDQHAMTWDFNGNVGIGITNPNNKLDVKGTIHSQEVKVDMEGWSDFVFEKEYPLPTLEQVEKHINEKGHLENIPSEDEVLKNGINLGEMNAKLLQKIEEMTLYMIDQNIKLDSQEKKIDELKKEKDILKSLSERLSKVEQQLK